MTSPPYAGIAIAYLEAGWSPLPTRGKGPPPYGFTGHRGTAASGDDVARWIEERGQDNVSLRLPPDVVGLDIDDYVKDGATKPGAATLSRLEAALGPLPSTWTSTSRGPGVSGIRLYRVPENTRLRTQAGPGIEIIQHHHRYLVVAPSIHPDTGRRYDWYVNGRTRDDLPQSASLPDLPEAWLEDLSAAPGQVPALAVPTEEIETFISDNGEALKPEMLEMVRRHLDAASGARHDALVESACWALREAAAGWYSARAAVDMLRRWWEAVHSDPARLESSEFGDAIAWAVGQALGAPGRIEILRQKALPSTPRAAIATAVPSPDPDRFFNKDGLLHADLREAVLDEGPIVSGPGRQLFYYEGGVYKSGGDDESRRRLSVLLGNRYRKSHVEGVVWDLVTQRPFITDAPPVGYINCLNGLLDLASGKLLPHDHEVASTYQLPVNWNLGASCPTVDAWLAQVAPSDAIDLIWEVIGACIYPDIPVHKAVLLHGPGRNGKGTFLRLVTNLVGSHNVGSITLQDLGQNRYVGAELFGKVANIAGDLDSAHLKRTDLFKMATGGDLIHAERKYGQPFSFYNRATMLFSANELPGTSDRTDGFFSRWVIVPFDKLQLAPGTEDPNIETAMAKELDGVLVKAIEGLRRLLTNHAFTTPQSVKNATKAYRTTADPVRQFADDSLAVTHKAADREVKTTVYRAYKDWCDNSGHKPLSNTRFYEAILRLDGIDTHRDRNGRHLTGIQLRHRFAQ